jgi:hypothetical protein
MQQLSEHVPATENPPSIEELKNVVLLGCDTVLLLALVITNVVHSSLILFILKMKAIRFSETSILTRAARRHIPEDGILHSHRREKLRS